MDNQTEDFGVQRVNRKTLKYIYEEISKLLTIEEQLEVCKISVNEKLIELLINENYPRELLPMNMTNYIKSLG